MNGEQKPNLLESQPVLTASGIAAAVQAAIVALITMAASFGWITVSPDQMTTVQGALTAIGALAVLVVPQLIAVLWARGRVTPLADPHTKDKEPAVIIPVAQAQQMGILSEARHG